RMVALVAGRLGRIPRRNVRRVEEIVDRVLVVRNDGLRSQRRSGGRIGLAFTLEGVVAFVVGARRAAGRGHRLEVEAAPQTGHTNERPCGVEGQRLELRDVLSAEVVAIGLFYGERCRRAIAV